MWISVNIKTASHRILRNVTYYFFKKKNILNLFIFHFDDIKIYFATSHLNTSQSPRADMSFRAAATN